MSIVGYARASTAAQDVELQKKAFDEAGVDSLFVEVCRGPRPKHTKLRSVLSQLQRGDTFVVYSLNLLGLNVCQLIDMVDELSRRGVGFRSLQEDIDTRTNVGKLVFRMLGAPLANLDRHLIRVRTEPGRAAAKAHGRKGGRKPKLDERERAEVIALHKDPSNAVPDTCQRFEISQSTYYRLVGKDARRRAGRKPKTGVGAG